jgi:putative ABC transport system permease protein
MPWMLLLQQIRRAWFRVLLTGGGIALAIFLMTTLRTINTSLESTVKAAGGNRLVVSSAVSLFVFLPKKVLHELEDIEGVAAVTHWTWFGGIYIDEKNMFGRFATDPPTLRKVYGDQSPGRVDMVMDDDEWNAFIENRASCVIGTGLAEQYELAVGDTIELKGNIFPGDYAFELVGIYESGSGQFDEQTMFFHWTYMDELAGRRGEVSTFTLQLEPGADLAAVAARVDRAYESSDHRTRTMTEAAFTQMSVSMSGNVPLLFDFIVGAVLFAAFMIALNTMLLQGQERRLDVGVLKALGFGNVTVCMLFVVEGIVVCGLGGAVGGLCSHWIFNVVGVPVVKQFFPLFDILPKTQLLGLGTALAVGGVSGFVPGVLAARMPVIVGLSRHG